jgi:hypothetical protein
MEPIFLRRSVWTASRLPKFISERCDFVVPKCGDAVTVRRRLSMPMSCLGVLQGSPRMLVACQVILLFLLLGNTVGMRGRVVQFGRPLMILVKGSVVVGSGH